MKQKILITGGSGFLGSHLCEALIGKYEVSVLDHNKPLVPGTKWATSLFDSGHVDEALDGIDIVVHLASRNGIDSSMKDPMATMDTNVMKTTILFDAIRRSKAKKVIFTSSTTVYGEGLHQCNYCHEMVTPVRDFVRYKSWECHCENCGNPTKPMYTTENFLGTPLSFYALSKTTQENILRMLIPYGIDVNILRFPIVYGPGQTESNKYCGAVGTIIKRALNNETVEIVEDGYQLRDFLYYKDCIDAIVSVIDKTIDSTIFNIATGKKNSLIDLCTEIQKFVPTKMNIKILGSNKPGDCRHSLINVTKAKGYLGFIPKYSLESGVKETIEKILQA